jgi:hypothetical protein
MRIECVREAGGRTSDEQVIRGKRHHVWRTRHREATHPGRGWACVLLAENMSHLSFESGKRLEGVVVGGTVVDDHKLDVLLCPQRVDRLANGRTVVVTGDKYCDAGSGVRVRHEFRMDASPAKARGSGFP